MNDDDFIKNLSSLRWNFSELAQAKRLTNEGKLIYITGDYYGMYITPKMLKPWHDIIAKRTE